MKTIKVADATNTQLDWLVAKCEGYERDTVTSHVLGKGFVTHDAPFGFYVGLAETFEPTTNPAQMWPIIEREGIDVRLDRDRVFDPGEKVERWYASKPFDTIPDTEWIEYGPTSLIAAARCYVASKLGETVEVPEELV